MFDAENETGEPSPPGFLSLRKSRMQGVRGAGAGTGVMRASSGRAALLGRARTPWSGRREHPDRATPALRPGPIIAAARSPARHSSPLAMPQCCAADFSVRPRAGRWLRTRAVMTTEVTAPGVRRSLARARPAGVTRAWRGRHGERSAGWPCLQARAGVRRVGRGAGCGR